MATRLQRLIYSARPTVKSTLESIFLRNLMIDELRDNVLDDPYRKSQLVYVCISTTARTVSQVPFIRYEMVDKGEDQVAEPVSSDDPWQQLMLYPNPSMNAFRFIEAIISRYLLDGNVFVVPFPPGSQMPSALYVVPVKHMTPAKDEATGQLIGWIYRPKGEGRGDKFLLSDEEVIHLATFNPNDPIIGQRPLEAGELAVKTDYKAGSFNERFFDNAAVPMGQITAPENVVLGKAQYQRLKAQIEGRHLGHRKAHRLLYLERGLKFEPMSISHKDMMFGDLKRMSQQEIMQCFGTVKAALSVTDDLNYATAKEQKQGWWNDTLLPMMKMISFGFTHNLLGRNESDLLSRQWMFRDAVRRMGPARAKAFLKANYLEGLPGNSYFDFDTANVAAMKEDLADKILSAQRLGRLGFTGNEINQRLELGFDELPFRDVWWKEPGLVAMTKDWQPGDPVPGQEPKPPPTPPPKPDEDEDEDEEHPPGGEPEEPSGGEEEPLEIPPEEESTPIGKGIEEGPPEEWEVKAEARWKQFVGSVGKLEETFQNRVNRTFFDMRKRALKHLLDNHDPQALLAEDFSQELSALSRWSMKAYRDALQAGMSAAGDEIEEVLEQLEPGKEEGKASEEFRLDVDFAIDADPELVTYLAKKTSLIKDLGKTIKKGIHERLSEGFQEGESVQKLADRIRDEFKIASNRAKTIARTEVIGTSNMGRAVALRQSGFTKKRWFTAMDERVRASHRAMQSHDPIPIDQKWELTSLVGGKKNMHLVKSFLRYPGDYEAGAPHETINCRCIEVVVPESHVTQTTSGVPEIPPDTQEVVEGMLEGDWAKMTKETLEKQLAVFDSVDPADYDTARGMVEKMFGTIGLQMENKTGMSLANISWDQSKPMRSRRLDAVNGFKFLAKDLAAMSEQQLRYVKNSGLTHVEIFREYKSDKYVGRENWRHNPILGFAYATQRYDRATKHHILVSMSPRTFMPSERRLPGKFTDTFFHEIGHRINAMQMDLPAKLQPSRKRRVQAKSDKATYYNSAWKLKAALLEDTQEGWELAMSRYNVGHIRNAELESAQMVITSYGRTAPFEDYAEMIEERMKDPEGWRVRTRGIVSSLRRPGLHSSYAETADKAEARFKYIDDLCTGYESVEGPFR